MKPNCRSVSKFLEEFQEIRIKSKERAGNLYANEINDLYHLGKGKPFQIMSLSWKFGFVCGLHYAKNQLRNGRTI